MKRSIALNLIIAAALAATACVVYAQTARFSFVNLDDPAYIFENPLAQRGLSLDSIRWAFTTLYLANYTPLTWLTYFADFQRAGLDPGAYHVTNFLFHAANSAILFFVLYALTFRVWPSALAAALFAVHPLHVESIAWISERKDVLSTFFGFLALWGYAKYGRAPTLGRYLFVFAMFTCSLLAKSMLVTLPCLLLVLDFWPLERGAPTWAARQTWVRLALEKLPFFAASAAMCVVTLLAQRFAHALPGTETLGIGDRLANALLSYVRYIEMTFWPHDLIPYYIHPKNLPWPEVAGAATLLTSTSIATWLLRKRAPYVLAGWLWYLGTLVPVIGLVQVGGQAMADRYTYVPLIGIFIVVAFVVADVVDRLPRTRIPVAVACLAAVAALGWSAHAQAARWRDSITLYEYTLRISPANGVVLGNLGEAYVAAKRYDDAVATIGRALELQPANAGNLRNLGHALRKLGRFEEAAKALREAVQLQPEDAGARNDLGLLLVDIGQHSSAYREFGKAVELDPKLLDARVNYGNWFLRAGDLPKAEEQYNIALDIQPRSAEALTNLAALLMLRKEFGRAEVRLRQALAINPDDAVTRTNLAAALMELGDWAGARRECEAALQIDPAYAKARALLEALNEKKTP